MTKDDWPLVLFEKSQFPSFSDDQLSNLKRLIDLVDRWITNKNSRKLEVFGGYKVLVGYKEENSVKSALKDLVEKAGYQAEVADSPHPICPDRWMIVLKR